MVKLLRQQLMGSWVSAGHICALRAYIHFVLNFTQSVNHISVVVCARGVYSDISLPILILECSTADSFLDQVVYVTRVNPKGG